MSRRSFFSNRIRGIRGLSLAELLVAITLSAILLGGAVTLFINNRDTYNTTNELSRLQETARYALSMMVNNIRQAGYFGCSDRLETVTNNWPVAVGDDGALWDFNISGPPPIVTPIEGLEADSGEFLPSGFAVTHGNDGDNGEVMAGTDAITLRYLRGSASLDRMMTPPEAPDFTPNIATPGADSQIFVNSIAGFAVGQLVAISDCGGTDIFRITERNTDDPDAQWMKVNALSRPYEAVPAPTTSPMLAPFIGVRYYIGGKPSGPGGAIYPSLYRTVLTGALTEARQELFAGVERMEILYGVDTVNDDQVADTFVKAGDAPLDTGSPSNWANVVSVRIAIVVRTIDERGRAGPGNIDDKTYDVNGTTFNPVDDRRRRRVFATTISLRN
ncbi:MAG: PilW family protein [Gammaproteobacteria bacterium]|nr:MAG: PilW family protein [Gammaproteobacteria bacterium]